MELIRNTCIIQDYGKEETTCSHERSKLSNIWSFIEFLYFTVVWKPSMTNQDKVLKIRSIALPTEKERSRKIVSKPHVYYIHVLHVM